jgi:hypothetical protein
MVCIVIIGKGNAIHERTATSSIMIQSDLIKNKELNEPEQAIITLLHDIKDHITQQHRISEVPNFYSIVLEEYLSHSGVNLSASNAAEVIHKLQKLEHVMEVEKKFNYKEMTLDGRARALQLSQEIYELCGLSVTYNIRGDMEQITNLSGAILYKRERIPQQSSLHMEALFITLGFILLFLILCIIYAKKSHLFVKDAFIEEYEDYENKEYA